MKKQTAIDILYNKYAYLAKKYARDIFNAEKIGMEYEDIEQEFSIKIYTTILAYLKRFKEYKETGNNKPVALKFYIGLALSNKSNDLIRFIKRQGNEISSEQVDFDYGVENHVEIDAINKRFYVNDIDLLMDLKVDEKPIFIMYLKGFDINFINKVYNGKYKPSEVIRQQIQKLRSFKNDLLSTPETFKVYSFDED